MKYLKYYDHLIEDEHTTPQFNDYVSCKEDDNENNNNLKEFISNNIGKIFKFNPKTLQYQIQYDYIPDNLKGRFIRRNGKYFRWLPITNIIEFDKSLPKLKLKLQSNKYNL